MTTMDTTPPLPPPQPRPPGRNNHQHHQQDVCSNTNNNDELFQQSIGDLLMAIEECRQQVRTSASTEATTAPQTLQWRQRMEGIMLQLHQLGEPTNEIQSDLRKNCEQRAGQVALLALQSSTARSELDPLEADPEFEREYQGAVARLAELNLMLNISRSDEIVDLYVQYQRDVIRQRAKPSIARLVQYRNHNLQEEDEEERQKSQHSFVITTILGQASALIHPLLMWKSHLPTELTYLQKLCTQSISTLDEQAQTLSQRVISWCTEDLLVDDWIARSATNDDESSSSHKQENTTVLSQLDGVVEEVAFVCQVLDRYLSLMNEFGPTTSSQTILQQLHPELIWKYTSLERYLTTKQWQSALALANPVEIVIGTKIQVPSVVEDAQYLCSRSVQRAASTRSKQAIGTVAHSIASDVWSTDNNLTGGVHQALLDQKGCWKDRQVEENKSSKESAKTSSSSSPKKPSSSDFASALMDALDDDLTTTKAVTTNVSKQRPPSAPGSAGFLGSLSSLAGGGGDKLLKIRLDTHFCALNGIYSASAACASLVKFLDTLHDDDENKEQEIAQPKGFGGNGERKDATVQPSSASTSSSVDAMTQLAREELFRYSKDYNRLLEVQVALVIEEFCGTPHDPSTYKSPCFLHVIKYFLEREDYHLSNAQELQSQEDDSRLHQQWIQPLIESKFLSESVVKSESNVLQIIHERLATALVELILDGIVSKKFTDWGSLLLSKQVRLLQQHLSQQLITSSPGEIPATAPSQPWEKLSQVLTVLQLEKPSDWSLYYQSTSILTIEELERFLKLRIDFSSDAIAAVVTSIGKTIEGR